MSKKNGSSTPLHGAYKPQIIAQLDQKNGGVNTVVMSNYKCEKNEVPTTQSANGSTVPLVDYKKVDQEAGEVYDPFQNRKLDHPTSDLDTLIHLLKGSLGSGILAMPMAFAHAGLFMGLFYTFTIGIVCTYCVHILVKCAHELCRRTRVPSLGFAEVAEAAFLSGPSAIRPWAKFAKAMINLFLVIDLIGCCCVYVVFVADSLKAVIDALLHYELDARLYMVALLPILIVMNLIRNLKYLSPLSMVANILVATGMGITFYYIFSGLSIDTVAERPAVGHITDLPAFFAIAIFALEGVGVVMSLENNMKTPTHFIGCPGVLNIGMFVVVFLYAATGFLGYLKYGEITKPSITLNLPHEPLAYAVKLMIALAVFITYALQFYVPMEIIWKAVKNNVGSRKTLAEYGIRVAFVILTVIMAVLIPNLEAFISLVGAVCLSTLGLVFPSIIDLVTCYDDPGLGRLNWRLWKNLFLMCFGLLGFLTGTHRSINQIIYG